MDTLEGTYSSAIARYFVHPDITLNAVGGSGTMRSRNDQEIQWVIEKGSGKLVESSYHPAFGLSVPNMCLEVTAEDGQAIVRFDW